MNQWTARDYLRVLFRQKRIILTATIVMTCVAVAGALLTTKQYEAEVKMLVSGQNDVEATYYKPLIDNENNPESLTQIEIVNSDPVLQRTVRVLKLYDRPFDYEAGYASPLKKYWIELMYKIHQHKMTAYSNSQQQYLSFRQAVENLRKNIKVEPVKDTDIFSIQVRDYDPSEAAVIANVVSRSYVIFDLEQQLAELQLKYGSKHPMVVQMQNNIDLMKNHLSGHILPDTESIGPASVKIIQQASIPLQPVNQHRSLIVILAMVTGLFLGMVLAFIFEYMDQSIKSGSEAEEFLHLPLVGNIPKLGNWHKLINKFPQHYMEGLNNLSDQISLLQLETGFKSLLLTACNANDGTSNISSNLAITACEYSGKKVLLIDANLRNPSLQKIFKIQSDYGLDELLMGEKDLDEVLYEVKPGLHLISGVNGKYNPMTLLGSGRMRELIDELKGKFDLIIIDSPQLSDYHDGLLLASIADKTLLVVAESHTRRQVALKTLASLAKLNGKMLGMVLNRRLYPIPGWLYHQV